MIIYINNILIYSKIEEEYIRYIKTMLKSLKKVRLRVKIKKLVFHAKKVNFLRYIIISRKIEIKRKKVDKISSWLELKDQSNL